MKVKSTHFEVYYDFVPFPTIVSENDSTYFDFSYCETFKYVYISHFEITIPYLFIFCSHSVGFSQV